MLDIRDYLVSLTSGESNLLSEVTVVRPDQIDYTFLGQSSPKFDQGGREKINKIINMNIIIICSEKIIILGNHKYYYNMYH